MLKLVLFCIYCWLLAPRPQLGFSNHYCMSSFSGCDPFIFQFPRLIPGSLLLFWALGFWTLSYDLALWVLTISVSVLCTWCQPLMTPTKPWKLFLVGLILEKAGPLFKWWTYRPSGLKRSLEIVYDIPCILRQTSRGPEMLPEGWTSFRFHPNVSLPPIRHHPPPWAATQFPVYLGKLCMFPPVLSWLGSHFRLSNEWLPEILGSSGALLTSCPPPHWFKDVFVAHLSQTNIQTGYKWQFLNTVWDNNWMQPSTSIGRQVLYH